MNKEKLFAYFKRKSQSKDETDGIQINNVLTSSLLTGNVTSAEHAYAKEKMQKKYECPKKVKTPAKIQKEVGLYPRDFGTALAIKKFTTKYLKYSYIRTTVNTWKKKCNAGDWTRYQENWKTQPIRL